MRIAAILPKGEGFSRERFGAIALCVRDFTLESRYRSQTLVIGGIPSQGFEGVAYETPPLARWFENRTRAYARGAAKIIVRHRVALAEIHNRPRLVRMLAQNTTCRLGLHLHNDPHEMEDSRTPEERLNILSRASAVYCVSRYIRNRFLEGLPAEAEKRCYVVPNGIEIPTRLPEKEKRIIFAGRMTEGKGALLLAQALAKSLPALPGWKAIVIGSERHGGGRLPGVYEREVRAALSPLGAQVEMAGFLEHGATLGHFARAAIAVVPSVWNEPFGRTALEAMAYGCALISSGRGGLKEVTGSAALTLDELSVPALAQAITMLAEDDDRRLRLQTLARARAGAFAIKDCARALDEARGMILAGASHAA